MTGARLTALILAVALTVVACDSGAYQTANGFVKKWTGASIRQTLRYTLGIPTGSSIIDDMVDSQRAADQMAVAEKLYKAAIENNDRGGLETATDLADQAIVLRPEDWRYRIVRASLAIQQGDVVEMGFQLSEARPRPDDNDLTSPDSRDEAREIRSATIVEFEKLAARLQFHDRGPCESFFLQLRNLYQDRLRDGGDTTDPGRNQQQADRYDGLYQQCATLPR